MDTIEEQIERDLKVLQNKTIFTDAIRTKTITKLSTTLDNMSLDPDADKPSVIMAKQALVQSLLGALNDVDSQARGNLKIKQQAKAANDEKDSAKLVSRTIAEFMKTIKPTLQMMDGDEQNTDIDNDLEKLKGEQDIEILEGEKVLSEKNAQNIEV